MAHSDTPSVLQEESGHCASCSSKLSVTGKNWLLSRCVLATRQHVSTTVCV